MITIKSDGEVVVDVVGAQGRDCQKIVEPLHAALGQVKEEEKKPEFYQGRISGTVDDTVRRS